MTLSTSNIHALSIALLLLALTGVGPAEEQRSSENREVATSSPSESKGRDGGHADEVRLTSDAVAYNRIRLSPTSRRVLARTLSVPARLSFNTDAIAHVGSVFRGRAVAVKVKLGDAVRKDDDLAVIESPELGELQADFIQRKTAVSVAESALDPAKQSAERARTLFDQNQGIALGEVQRREAEYRAAQGTLITAKAALIAAENKLRLLGMSEQALDRLSKTGEVAPRLAIKAPLGGRVIEKELTLGELVSPDKEALLVIADMSTLWVLADVPDSRLREVRVGAAVRVHLGAEDVVEGMVSLVGSEVDVETRTTKVRIEVPNPEGHLRPGLFARADVAIATEVEQPAQLAVPEAAVLTVEGGLAVFVPVAGEPNTFAKRPVSAGKPVGGFVPILGGLTEGERVVTSGAFILKAELGKGGAAHED